MPNRSTRSASAKRPRIGSARENWDRAEAAQARREKSAGGAASRSKVRRTGSGSGRTRTPPGARKRGASATREADATEQPRSPTRRVARRGTAPTALDGGAEAADAAAEADDEAEEAAEEAPDDASEGSDTHGERRVESLQRAATVRGAGEVASLVLVKWASLPQATPSPQRGSSGRGLALARVKWASSEPSRTHTPLWFTPSPPQARTLPQG